MSKMHRPVKFVIWFPIVLVAAFAVGYLFWQKTLVPGPYDLEQVNLVGNGGNNQLEGWQTYRNEKYGFEFKYPGEWGSVMFEEAKAGESAAEAAKSIMLKTPDTGETFAGYFSKNKDCRFGSLSKDYSYGSTPPGYVFPLEGAKKHSTYLGDGSIEADYTEYFPSDDAEEVVYVSAPHVSVLIKFDRSNYDFLKLGCYNPDNVIGLRTNKESFNQILSTFKFIEPIDVSGWQTYRNDKYGFEFKYPAEFDIKIQKDYLVIERWITLKSSTHPSLLLKFENGRSDYKTFDELAVGLSKLACDADGHNVSVYCTDIISKTVLVNKNGISGLELYLKEVVETFNQSTGQRINTDKLRGPIYVFDVASQTNNKEQGLFVNYYGLFTDKQLLNQIFSTFKFIK